MRGATMATFIFTSVLTQNTRLTIRNKEEKKKEKKKTKFQTEKFLPNVEIFTSERACTRPQAYATTAAASTAATSAA